MRYLSPLRYPGGKSGIAGFVAALLASQPSPPRHYVESFAGGAGVALWLLVGEHVETVVLNDLDRGIAAFWRSVFFDTTALVRRVRRCRPTVGEWERQRAIHGKPSTGDLELGFSTFFLNRTNHSGILRDARPIGGFDQHGTWKIDARFNAEKLADRIERVGRFRSRVTVLERDGVRVARAYAGQRETFLYVDPPYLTKGAVLYLDTLDVRDHARLASCLREKPGWMLTYDQDPRVRALYPEQRRAVFSMPHTAGRHHTGTEYAIFADGLIVPALRSLGLSARFSPSSAA